MDVVTDTSSRARDAVDHLFDAIRSGDVATIQAAYVHDDRLLVFTEGPPGKVEGWDQESNAREWSALLDLIRFTELRLDEDVRADDDGRVAWLGGTVHLVYEPLDGGVSSTLSNRGTWIFSEVDGALKIVFEHVSFPLDNPYPLPA